jgi:hypothetical protein
LFLSPFPVSSLAEVGVRGSVVLVVYELFFKNQLHHPSMELSLVAAMMGLWIVNLALPSFAGALIGIRSDFFKRNKN